MLLTLDVSQVMLGRKEFFPQYGKTKGFGFFFTLLV